MTLLALGINHKTAPVSLRERVTFSPDTLDQALDSLLTIPFSAQHMDGSEMMKLVGWAQSVVTFHGGASAHLDGVAFIFRMHLVLGMTLFLLFPFSRLVHIWSVPVEYLTRKYQIVRARH